MLTVFKLFFTVRIRRNFVILLSLAIPLHLAYVAALFCDNVNVLKKQMKTIFL